VVEHGTTLRSGEQVHAGAELAEHVVDVPQAVAQRDVVGGLAEVVDVVARGSQQAGGVKEAPRRRSISLFRGLGPLHADLDPLLDTQTGGFLEQERNGPWLGRPVAPSAPHGAPGTAADALAALDRAYGAWSAVLAEVTEESLGQPIGAIAGRCGRGTRRSFVLHIVDELIHHGAEAALLRDLYAETRRHS
jgi:hypothetical protein